MDHHRYQDQIMYTKTLHIQVWLGCHGENYYRILRMTCVIKVREAVLGYKEVEAKI